MKLFTVTSRYEGELYPQAVFSMGKCFLSEGKFDGWVRGRILSVVVCPHCGTTGVKHNIVRRHFDKCSKKSL